MTEFLHRTRLIASMISKMRIKLAQPWIDLLIQGIRVWHGGIWREALEQRARDPVADIVQCGPSRATRYENRT